MLDENLPLKIVQKPSFFSNFKNIFKFNIWAFDALVVFILLTIFSSIYFFVPKKLDDSYIVSPLQNINKIEKPVFAVSDAVSGEPKEVIGFLPSWIVAQNPQVDVTKLTQLIYFGFGVNENGELVKYKEDGEPVLEWHYFNSDSFTSLMEKAKENQVKVLVAFKMFNNETIDNLISNSVYTDYFIKNVLKLLEEYDLDGINLDIEYFTDSDFPTGRFLNTFLDKVSKSLKEENPKYIVSIDVNATVIVTDRAYDMVKIGEVADQIIVMAYDYHMPSSSRAGPVAPLDGPVNTHNINKSINSLAGRVAMDKVVLGVPFYGYEWQTVDKNYKSATIAGTGALATYKRVQELLENRDDIEKYWDEESQSPWLTYEQSGAIKQIYYEDEQSLKAKADFAKENDLAGIAIWTLGYEGKYQEVWEALSL